eukprot:Clim_evm14s196 gene=Clim_evmTU14s196
MTDDQAKTEGAGSEPTESQASGSEGPTGDVQVAGEEMFAAIEDYLRAEVQGALIDYELLKAVNVNLAKDFREMRVQTDTIARRAITCEKELDKVFTRLKPYHELQESVTNLEIAVQEVENIVNQLEERFDKVKAKPPKPNPT